MNNESFYTIQPDGTVNRVDISVTELDVKEDVLRDALLKNNISRVAGVATASSISAYLLGNIGMSIGANYAVASARVNQFVLNTRIATANGIITPDFAAKDGPFVSLLWNVPGNMDLIYAVWVDTITMTVKEQFLVAAHKGAHYRLPITNLYANCRICAGQYEKVGSSILDCFGRSWVQFNKSPYNLDLVNEGTETLEYSKQLFRFEPKGKDEMECLPPDHVDWLRLCAKVGNEFLQQHIVV